jgi:hypothetical protein
VQVLAGRADGVHRLEVIERVDRFGAGSLEEELRDLRPALLQGLDAVGEIAAVGVGLARERHEQVRVGPGFPAAHWRRPL